MSTKIIGVISLAIMFLGYGCAHCTDYGCETMIYASDVPRWLAQFNSDISYEDGVWYANGTPVGVSPIEDGDVCAV